MCMNIFACILFIAILLLILFNVLEALQRRAERNLPHVNPGTDAYSACVGRFMADMTMYMNCVDEHASKKCIMEKHRMTNVEDSHNCLSLITVIPDLSFNAKIIKDAHDVCYTYLKTYSKCLGLAVEVAEFEQCFRKEVFARTGAVVGKCKVEAGIDGDPKFDNVGWGMHSRFGAVGEVEKEIERQKRFKALTATFFRILHHLYVWSPTLRQVIRSFMVIFWKRGGR